MVRQADPGGFGAREPGVNPRAEVPENRVVPGSRVGTAARVPQPGGLQTGAPHRGVSRPANRAAVAAPPPTSDTVTHNWRKWFPGLDNDAVTLRKVLSTLPAAPPVAIPWIVRLFENPEGWLRLHGAVNLADHDKIHVLLGRGLLDQDEAFVLGFTMGCTKAVSRLESWFFKVALAHLYPHPYRVPVRILAAFDLGLEAGREFGRRNVHLLLTKEMLDRPLGELRAELGIDTRRLRHYYARERALLPDTPVSRRLPMPLPQPERRAEVN